jgi:hypothetical protein
MIQYEIPYGTETCKSAWIGARETWTNFKWCIAEEMDCPVTQLKLGYKISTKPIQQAIHFLHSNDEYVTMVSNVLVAMGGGKSREMGIPKGRKVGKLIIIHLLDLHEKEAKKMKKVMSLVIHFPIDSFIQWNN